MKTKIIGLIPILLFSCGFLSGTGQERSEVTINAAVESRCKIEVSTSSVSFTRLSPDEQKVISQNEVPVEITIKATVRKNQRIYLRIRGLSDLVDAQTGQKIDVSNISWEATGSGFTSGQLHLNPRLIGSWNRSGVQKGTITFYLQNRPDYVPGVYHLTVSMSVSTF